MGFRISFAPSARTDLERAYLWISERNPEAANVWYNEIVDAISSLKNLPARCPKASESADVEQEIRQLLYGKRGNMYRILFVIVENESLVRVIHIRHTAQQRLSSSDFESP